MVDFSSSLNNLSENKTIYNAGSDLFEKASSSIRFSKGMIKLSFRSFLGDVTRIYKFFVQLVNLLG